MLLAKLYWNSANKTAPTILYFNVDALTPLQRIPALQS